MYKPHMNRLEDQHHQLKENACRNVTTVQSNFKIEFSSIHRELFLQLLIAWGIRVQHSGESAGLIPMWLSLI